jgi:hypothetical protein
MEHAMISEPHIKTISQDRRITIASFRYAEI